MKSRNPVAGNAYRFNRAHVIPNKKRDADYWKSQEDWLPEYEEDEDDEDPISS